MEVRTGNLLCPLLNIDLSLDTRAGEEEEEEEEEVAMGPLLFSSLCSLFLKRRKASSRPHAAFSFLSLGVVEGATY